MEVRVSRASSVIVHHVPPGGGDRFLEWERGISDAMAQFPGYQATEVYPPVEGQQQEWVVVLHFSNSESLQRWLDSSVRAEWLAKLRGVAGDFELKTLPAGFGSWFTGNLGSSERLPPDWKMVLTVLLALYPTVMLLTIFVGPLTNRFGLAAGMLISNAMSVSLLQWVIMPVLRVVLSSWLRAGGREGKPVTVGGLVLILLVLAGLMLLFRAVTG